MTLAQGKDLVVTTYEARTGIESDDGVLNGTYECISENHGRPVYCKKQAPGHSGPEVQIYFWESKEPADNGWWFGRTVGSEQVWARHVDSSDLPPLRGWSVVASQDSDQIELFIRHVEHAPAESRSPSPAQSRSPSPAESDDVPSPWMRVESNGTVYYWNELTGDSTWEKPGDASGSNRKLEEEPIQDDGVAGDRNGKGQINARQSRDEESSLFSSPSPSPPPGDFSRACDDEALRKAPPAKPTVRPTSTVAQAEVPSLTEHKSRPARGQREKSRSRHRRSKRSPKNDERPHENHRTSHRSSHDAKHHRSDRSRRGEKHHRREELPPSGQARSDRDSHRSRHTSERHRHTQKPERHRQRSRSSRGRQRRHASDRDSQKPRPPPRARSAERTRERPRSPRPPRARSGERTRDRPRSPRPPPPRERSAERTRERRSHLQARSPSCRRETDRDRTREVFMRSKSRSATRANRLCALATLSSYIPDRGLRPRDASQRCDLSQSRSRSRSRKVTVELKTRTQVQVARGEWPAPMTKTPPGKQIHLPGVVGNDEGLEKWLREEAEPLLEWLGPGPLDCIDVSNNSLTDSGVNSLVKFMLKNRQPSRRLKMFSNAIEEPMALCDLLEDSDCGVGAPDGLAELHLSHNRITARMLERLLETVGRRVQACGGWLSVPLWIRVEHNPPLLEAGAARDYKDDDNRHGFKLCLRAGETRSGCTVKYCKHSADVHLVFAKK